ncbi:MAG: hypothetical protein JO262_04150 [Solirubrobacterales bacterium]|nr:hypothetical protein [Solirubrobacterales bacterium]MBV9941301.1 hypothetical protein [Solirubrobacterales bacterium]
MSGRLLWITACVFGLAVGLGACGEASQPTSVLNNGVYVTSGPITYQLQVSRELNPYLTEDAQYVSGLPTGAGALGANQLWYGVFLWAKNQTKHSELTAHSFDIVDSGNHHYYPLQLNAGLNGYAWTPQLLPPAGQEPKLNTTASFGPTQGGLLLFKLPTAVYSNRPLTLEIFPPGGGKQGDISLDL